jgi:hypothetical protein
MRHLVSLGLILAGIIHLLPVSGVVGAERLAALYGTPFSDPNLIILMRHRAVLFGLLGLFLVISAFKPTLQPAALVAGLASVVSFLVLAWSVGGYNAQIHRVVVADLVALVALVVGGVAYMYARQRA